MLTCCVVTSTPQFRNALWTDIGLAGAPFRVVKATQYETAGQRDLLTLAKLPSSHCSLVALGIWLDWSSSSLSLLSSAVSSIMLAFFFSCVEIALKKNAILGIPRIKKKKTCMRQRLKMCRKLCFQNNPRADTNLKLHGHRHRTSCISSSTPSAMLFLLRCKHIWRL